jgi:MFS family permease
MPFMNSFWISRTGENNRGRYAAMYTIAWSTAQIAGPGFGSQIIAHKSYSSLIWAILIICGIAALGFSMLGKYSGPSPSVTKKLTVIDS